MTIELLAILESGPKPAPGLQEALNQVATCGIENADYALIEAVALQVWQGEELPNLSAISGSHLTDATLLLERLALLSRDRQDRKHALLAQIRTDWEPTAAEWRHFDKAFRGFLPRLWPIQDPPAVAQAALG